jgi:hypothetical protein
MPPTLFITIDLKDSPLLMNMDTMSAPFATAGNPRELKSCL